MLEALLPSLPSMAILIAITLGSLFVFRRTYVKQLGEMQEKVITAYKSENEAQELQIKTLEKKVQRLEGVLSTLQITLKKRRGLLIEINDDVITLVDKTTGAEHTVQIHVTDQHEAIKKEDEK